MDGLPVIIQGGMGAGVSSWRLARAVSFTGQLGVVSGTALDVLLARRLQDGDRGGHMRSALEHFPSQEIARLILDTYFIEGGKGADVPYKAVSMHSAKPCRALIELTIAANFAEVFLARQGHANAVGINYMEKLQLPHLPSIYGAMLAGVEYILMGAGIPLRIPGVLDAFVNHKAAEYPLYVAGAQDGDDFKIRFDPREYFEAELAPLQRPRFLPIIASNVLALTMTKKANGRVDGFIVEGPTAGGHNAPPRGKMQFDADGEVIYGERDVVDLAKLRGLGLPFWLAGGYGSPEKVAEALEAGAAGVQVGTAFALTDESDLNAHSKQMLIKQVRQGTARVRTDTLASPTGFPFKVAQLNDSQSNDAVYAQRRRVCDLGFLREGYRTVDGKLDFRCPAEPEAVYLAKGGDADSARGRKCLCNALMANIGMPQVRGNGYREPTLVTMGDDLVGLDRFLSDEREGYSALEVVHQLLSQVKDRQSPLPVVAMDMCSTCEEDRCFSTVVQA
ncbi:MAG TPA: nitronate monooxygenase [Candidatus Koribacter sp.]|jgi:nitronate monooxygenase